MTIAGLVTLILYLLVLGIVIWLVFWVLGQLGMPEPIGKILRIVIVVVAVLVLILLLLNFIGAGPAIISVPVK